MELHPILESQCSANPALWYVVSAFGTHPSERVGHTCTYIPGPQGYDGKVYVIGGANPDGPFSEVYVLDLLTFSWDILDCPGLKPRYEHAAFVPRSKPKLIYIFGGADQSGNHNDIQVLDTSTKLWSTLSVSHGNPPSARTYHLTSAVIGDKFYVYSGGQSGADPVGDRQVHCFDANDHSWTSLNTRGESPKPRHGHLLIADSDSNRLLVHGGMSGTAFYDDLHLLELSSGAMWKKHKIKRGTGPSARAAHAGCISNGYMYVFGGMCKEGALDDLFQLNLGNMKWSKIEVSGPSPASRLDLGLCTVKLKVPAESESREETTEDILATGAMARDVVEDELRLSSAGSVRSMSSSAGSQRSEPIIPTQDCLTVSPLKPSPPVAQELTGPCNVNELCLIVGGMDTEGEIFDDCLVYRLHQEPLEESIDGKGDNDERK